MKNKNLALVLHILLDLVLATFLVVVVIRKEIFDPSSVYYNLYESLDTFAKPLTRILVSVIKSCVVIAAVYLVVHLSKKALNSYKNKNQKALTAISLLQSLIKYIGAVVLVLLLLGSWGVDTTTLLASAGVLTLVIGLGCQSLVADFVAGLFIIFEGDFKVGDIVVISGWRGTVKSIGLRTTKIIDVAGNVKIINNSNISDVVNNTDELSLAICTCGVEYGESIERVENIIDANIQTIKERIPAIINGPFYKGIEELGDSAVVIKLIAECKEEDKFQVQRDMNRELKIILDKNNINIPFPQIVVNQPINFKGDVSDKERHHANEFVDDQKKLSHGLEDKDE